MAAKGAGRKEPKTPNVWRVGVNRDHGLQPGVCVCVCVCVARVCVCVCVCVCVLVAQSCLTLCNLMDCSPPGSSVPGIPQARKPEWVAMPFFRGSSQPRDCAWVSRIADRFFPV